MDVQLQAIASGFLPNYFRIDSVNNCNYIRYALFSTSKFTPTKGERQKALYFLLSMQASCGSGLVGG